MPIELAAAGTFRMRGPVGGRVGSYASGRLHGAIPITRRASQPSLENRCGKRKPAKIPAKTQTRKPKSRAGLHNVHLSEARAPPTPAHGRADSVETGIL